MNYFNKQMFLAKKVFKNLFTILPKKCVKYVCQYPRQVILYIVNTRKGCNHGWHFFHFYIKKMRYTKIWKINYQRQISFRQIGGKKKINPVRYSAGLPDPIFICTFTTVKPLYSGHHWDLKIVSVIERCSLHRGSS